MGFTASPSSLRARPRALLASAWLAATVATLVLAAPAGAVLSGGFGYQRREAPTIKLEPLQYHGGPVLHSSDSYAIYWDPTETYRAEWKEQIDEYMHDVGADRSLDLFAVDSQYGDGSGQAANASTFRGAYTDKDPYPASGCTAGEEAKFACLTDAQIRAELQHLVGSGALPGASGPAVYYLLTPPGVVVCTDEGGHGNCSESTTTKPSSGICGYHSAIDPGGAGQIVYAVQPWVAGYAGFVNALEPTKTLEPTEDVLACQGGKAPLIEPNQSGRNLLSDYATALPDVIVNDLSVEQSNIAVDPLLNGWYQTATNAEQSDMCQWNFGPPPESPPAPDPHTHAATESNETINGHTYYLQWAFDSTWVTIGRGHKCFQGATFIPRFTAPNPVSSGDVAGFDATESLLALQAARSGLPADEPYIAPVYSWDFGDGAHLAGKEDASVFHSFQYGGTYAVTLTITDSGLETDSYQSSVTVVGPPRPGGGGSGGGGSSSSSSSSSAQPTTEGGAGTPGAGAKIAATQSVLSHNLGSALRGGLVVRYSVSQQVAGRFEVLLASATARHAGLRGPAATSLTAGTPPQTVIAKAILVTTKGGHSTYRIKFSKTTAARLRKLRKVALTIRMVVHNASTPVATTVLDTVDLR